MAVRPMRDDAARPYAKTAATGSAQAPAALTTILAPISPAARAQQPARSMMPSGEDFMALEDVAAVAAAPLT